MLQRWITCGLLIFGAGILDWGLPVWFSSWAPPICLDLLLVGICLTLMGSELVAVAGLLGLAQESVLGMPAGIGMITAATLALPLALRRPKQMGATPLMDQLLIGICLLGALNVVRVAPELIDSPSPLRSTMLQAALVRTAVTFLVFFGLAVGVRGLKFITRQSLQFDATSL